jgi:hypothetical protein
MLAHPYHTTPCTGRGGGFSFSSFLGRWGGSGGGSKPGAGGSTAATTAAMSPQQAPTPQMQPVTPASSYVGTLSKWFAGDGSGGNKPRS